MATEISSAPMNLTEAVAIEAQKFLNFSLDSKTWREHMMNVITQQAYSVTFFQESW